jgi:hypothetical protein
MGRKSNAQKLQDIHREAVDEFDACWSESYPSRMQSRQDRRFASVPGAQWEDDIGQMYANRPKFEFNRIELAIRRIQSEWRANRITVDFVPKDGETGADTADVCDGLFRADEQASVAFEAYDGAFDEAIKGGVGAWEVVAQHEDDHDDDSPVVVRINPIHDADQTVVFDRGARRQDKNDAMRAWHLVPYTHKAFEEKFGEAPSSWDSGELGARDGVTRYGWVSADVVWVAKYYRKTKGKRTMVYFKQAHQIGFELPEGEEPDIQEFDAKDLDEETIEELEATGWVEVRREDVKVNEVRKYLMTHHKILEDCGVIAGEHIPLVPVYGRRWVQDGVEHWAGHVRVAKDAQRLMNMTLSMMAEIAGRFDVEKPIFSPEQMQGHREMWSNDIVNRYSYMLANNAKDANGQPIPGTNIPLAYTKAPNIPPATAALAQMCDAAMSELMGNQQAGEEVQANTSGKAVELVQNRLDMQVFIYLDNMAKAFRRTGQIWLSAKRDVVGDEQQRARTVNLQGKPGTVILNEPRIDKKTGKAIIANDLAAATFDVVADVGPSSSGKRAAMVRALTGMRAVTQDPETGAVLEMLALMEMEGEGLSDVQEWLRGKLLRIGAVKPTDEERAQLQAEAQQQQEDPQQAYLKAAALKEQAQATKAEADTLAQLAKVELTEAQTLQTLDTIGRQALPGEVDSPEVPREGEQQPQPQEQAPA